MPYDTTYHDDGTMRKVFDALSEAGVEEKMAINAVMLMQNKGILFRQSTKDRT